MFSICKFVVATLSSACTVQNACLFVVSTTFCISLSFYSAAIKVNNIPQTIFASLSSGPRAKDSAILFIILSTIIRYISSSLPASPETFFFWFFIYHAVSRPEGCYACGDIAGHRNQADLLSFELVVYLHHFQNWFVSHHIKPRQNQVLRLQIRTKSYV